MRCERPRITLHAVGVEMPSDMSCICQAVEQRPQFSSAQQWECMMHQGEQPMLSMLSAPIYPFNRADSLCCEANGMTLDSFGLHLSLMINVKRILGIR